MGKVVGRGEKTGRGGGGGARLVVESCSVLYYVYCMYETGLAVDTLGAPSARTTSVVRTP